jgi:hypothetical protein
MPTCFGATDTPSCPKCKKIMRLNIMRSTRRSPHPKYGYDFERQTFTCPVCMYEIEKDADSFSEVTQ